MKRTIYTLYIDIPESDLDITDDVPKNFVYGHNNTLTRNQRTKKQFELHAPRLQKCKIKYANEIGVDYKFFGYDDEYKEYHQMFLEKYPEITHYNIVNFYKIHLLYKLAEEYDEVLYLDFDAIPMTNESFFDAWDLDKGICVLHNNDKINPKDRPLFELGGTIRSPAGKYFNCKAMLMHRGMSAMNDVINTGIIGANSKHLKQLDYWGGFKENLDLMTFLVNDREETMFPENLLKMFGWDNETLFAYKIKENDVPIQWFDTEWHYFYDMELFIPPETKILHAINKKFETVWRAYEKRNL